MFDSCGSRSLFCIGDKLPICIVSIEEMSVDHVILIWFDQFTMAASNPTTAAGIVFPCWQPSVMRAFNLRPRPAPRMGAQLGPRVQWAPAFVMEAELRLRFAPTAVTVNSVSDRCQVILSSGHGAQAHRKLWTGPLHSTLWWTAWLHSRTS